MKFITRIFKHKHKFNTTHTNKFQHPTRQTCKCGLKRNLKTVEFGWCKWIYSDGTESEMIEWGNQ